MKQLFQNKKLVIVLSIVLAVVLATGVGILVWQLTKDDTPEPSTYTISFVTNGGNEIEPITVEKGTVLSQTDLPVPAKQGAMFLTWNTDEALTDPYWESTIDRDITLYASYLTPADTGEYSELIESVIPFADTDFSVTVRSSESLTNENLSRYAVLHIHYGAHKNDEEIKLSVSSEGDGIYRLYGNFATGGSYAIALVSDSVSFNEEDEAIKKLGLTDALRVLNFKIVGENYAEGSVSDNVTDIPVESILSKTENSVEISGTEHQLISADGNHGVIKVGDGDDISNYVKVEGIMFADGDSVTYKVRPAEADEVFDKVEGYHYAELDADDYVINEDVKQQIIENISTNEQLNNYVKYLLVASTETQTYQTLSTQEFGEVVAMPLSTIVTPVGVTVGLDFNAYNDNFSDILTEEKAGKFVKLTLGIAYEVKVAKVGSMGSITCYADLTVDFWIFIGYSANLDMGWLEYDIDFGSTVLTQTEITFNIGLQTASGRKYPNINDEIDAIISGATDPSPSNLLNLYNDLVGGGSQPIELFNQDIFEVPVISLFFGAAEISIPVKFVVTLDMQANFMSYFTVLTADEFGINGNEDTGLDAFHRSAPTRYHQTLELRGRIELRAGFEVGVRLSLAYDLSSVSLGVQIGFYGEIHGFFYYDVNYMDPPNRVTSMGGAYYFEFGTYIDIRLRAEVCLIKYTGSLWDIKFPLFTAGQKEVLYGFVDPTDDVITLENVGSMHLNDTGVWDVYIYDITEERSEDNPRIVEDYEFDEDKYDISFRDDYFALSQDRTTIELVTASSKAVETVMAAKYTGAQMSLRDAVTKYVTVRFADTSDGQTVDWDKINETYTVNFTINGKVVFSREVGYGRFFQRLDTHGTNESYPEFNLRVSEREAIYNAGYERASWVVQSNVTKDMSIEATDLEKRKVKVIVHTGVGNFPLNIEYGETPLLDDYEDKRYIDSSTPYLVFDSWSPTIMPATEDETHYYANYKVSTATVRVEVASTTDAGVEYEANTVEQTVSVWTTFLSDVIDTIPSIGQKTLKIYEDAAYTKPISVDPLNARVYEDITYYARYEDIAQIYFYNHYGTFIKGESVPFGEKITPLTNEELSVFAYISPEDIASGETVQYIGMTNVQYGTEVIDIYSSSVNQYVILIYPVFGDNTEYYEVVFLNRDGSRYMTTELAYGTDVTGLATLAGYSDEQNVYRFVGWKNVTDESAGNKTTGICTFEPVFEVDGAVEYTVSFFGVDGVTDERGNAPSLTGTFTYSELEDAVATYLEAHSFQKVQNGLTYVMESYQLNIGGGIGAVTLSFREAKASVTYQTGEGTLLSDGIGVANESPYTVAIDGAGCFTPVFSASANDANKKFVGWLINGTTYGIGQSIPITDGDEITLIAVYESKDFTVTLTDGDEVVTLYADAGEVLNLPVKEKDATAQYSYAFLGWKDINGNIHKNSYTVTRDAALTSTFEETLNSYTVTFDANGGLIGGDATYSTTLAYGTMPAISTTPTRASTETARYEFAGWSPELTAVTGEATYTAQWTEIKLYTVTFNAGEGQFDSSGKNTVTITVDEGHTITSDNLPMNPYKKTDAGYYEFSVWSPAVSVGTVINGDATYTAIYQSELSTRTGITISDGVNSEDIAAFLNGTSKITGYNYVLDNEYFGKALTITANGLTLSGEAKDIHIEVNDANVTFADLNLSYTGGGYVSLNGIVELTVDGTVRITSDNVDGGDTIRGDNSSNDATELTLRGADADSRLIINSKQYGIAVYGTLTIDNLDMDLTVSAVNDTAAAIQSHDSGTLGILAIKDSAIVVNAGQVTAAQLIMENSTLNFKSTTFTSGAVDGLYMMSYHYSGAYAADYAVISLTNSQISFAHDIAIGIAVSIIDEEVEYFINSDIDTYGITSTYASFDAFIADVNAKGYSGMVVVDSSSAIQKTSAN